MPRFTAIDLTGLTPPDVVETLSFESILTTLKNDVTTRLSLMGVEFDVAMLESEPVVKVLEVAAYRETVLRARVNSAARAVMLAFAQNNDLDQLGAYYVTPRESGETDERYRTRIQLAPEAFSTAGPSGAYAYHTYMVDESIKDVGVYKSAPGTVDVLPLVDTGNGMPSTDLIEAVRTHLDQPDIRPLTDVLNVRAPSLTQYDIAVTLTIAEGPDSNLVKAAAQTALAAYALARHKVGVVAYRSGITRAAQVDGVENVVITSPSADVDPGIGGVAYANSITVTV
jgi:phage-related baseplate assembly protein